MFTKTTYVGTLNGIHGLWCGFKPNDITVEQEIQVLYPEEGYLLEKDGEKFSSVVLENGLLQEDFKEIEEVFSEEVEDISEE